MHPGPFQPRADRRLAASLDHVGAQAQACSAEVGVAHPVAIAFEVLGAPLVPSSVA